MFLRFKKEILEAARKADRAIINVVANETWAELKILVPYDGYRHSNGLADLREQIEAENPGAVIPPLSMKCMRSASTIERYYQAGRLPKNAASVIFKVPGKVAAQKLLVEMWVAGNKFRALPYIPSKADSLCGMCGQWGHSEFRCQRGSATCTICAGSHRTEEHRCEVATCGKVGKVCPHMEMKCPNCRGRHPAQDARCRAKRAAIEIARGKRTSSPCPEMPTEKFPVQPVRPSAAVSAGRSALLNWIPGGAPVEASPDWTEDPMEVTATGMGTSGTAPPVAVWWRSHRLQSWWRSHNCARGGQVLQAVLESAVQKGADLVLIQEPRGGMEKDSTRSHRSFRFIRGEKGKAVKCWVAVNRESRCQVTELKDLTRDCANYAQALEVKPPSGPSIIIVNIYDRKLYGGSGERLAQRANWEAIARHNQVVIAGDMNVHSQMWNGRATSRRNASFWENLITDHSLVVWNSEEATRVGGDNHSIIDFTLTVLSSTGASTAKRRPARTTRYSEVSEWELRKRREREGEWEAEAEERSAASG